MSITWEPKTEKKFRQMIEKVPSAMRGMAEAQVTKKAEEMAAAENRNEITEKDMIDAFFAVTPFGFHGPMKSDMESVGIDYTKYGHEK